MKQIPEQGGYDGLHENYLLDLYMSKFTCSMPDHTAMLLQDLKTVCQKSSKLAELTCLGIIKSILPSSNLTYITEERQASIHKQRVVQCVISASTYSVIRVEPGSLLEAKRQGKELHVLSKKLQLCKPATSFRNNGYEIRE
eukprot:scaffold106955_cov17-Tisochrysis_lutea.AAC.1